MAGGRYWVRTSDLFGVNEARYHCANRPRWTTVPHRCGGDANLDHRTADSNHGEASFCHRHPQAYIVFHAPNGPTGTEEHADVAQLVEHHLAKVRVAGSNPVVRSERVSLLCRDRSSPVEWPRGEATDCKSVYTGSNPVSTSGGWRSW